MWRWLRHIVQAPSASFYLTRQLGYAPSQIITDGDSFTGALNLQLNRYILTNTLGHEFESNEEKPGAMLLFSPFCDARVDGGENLPPPAPLSTGQRISSCSSMGHEDWRHKKSFLASTANRGYRPFRGTARGSLRCFRLLMSSNNTFGCTSCTETQVSFDDFQLESLRAESLIADSLPRLRCFA